MNTVHSSETILNPKKSTVLNVSLILTPGSDWIIDELAKWFPDKSLSIQCIQLTSSLAYQAKLYEKPTDFWELVHSTSDYFDAQEKHLDTICQKNDWSIQNILPSDTSEQGVADVIKQINQSDCELVIIGLAKEGPAAQAGQDLGERFTSHFNKSTFIIRKPLDIAHPIQACLPIDSTAASVLVRQKITQLFKPSQLSITAVNVVEYPMTMSGSVFAGSVNTEMMTEELQKYSSHLLKEVRQELEGKGVPFVASQTLHGTAGEEITDFLKRQSLDLVVMGAHNRAGLSRWLIGSVSHRVLISDEHNFLVVR